ncbi:MAG: hypothetical protein D3910_24575 [Candidatus Electrothrix sp. ATG2]|nr:hypothetical protein [Candidatus Electrothrix sp. ATG2]
MSDIVTDARRRNRDNKRPWVVVMDGALGLWSAITLLLSGVKWVGILNIIHVVEYLWKAGNAVYGEGKPETLQSVIRYLENHKQWMKYDEYLLKGYPIGSGIVESTCGHTVKNRATNLSRDRK